MFDVGCLTMTQHLSLSVENGPDLGWKNLFRLFHLFFFFFFLNGIFFPFAFFSPFLRLKAVDPWRLAVIASDMTTFKEIFYIGLWPDCGCSVSVTFSLTGYCRSAACDFSPGTIMLTMVLNLRSAVDLMFGSGGRLIKLMLRFSPNFLSQSGLFLAEK